MKYIGLFDEKEDIATKEKLDAVEAAIPTKTSQLDNDSGFITASQAPVQSVNNKTGAVSLTASDVGALPEDTVIPTVNNATLTIKRNSIDVGSFTANAANDVNIDINVPTDKSDIGLGNVDNVKQYSATNPPPYPVTGVNGKTGAVTLSATDVSAIPSTLTGTAGQVLTKTANGQEWKDVVKELPAVTASDNGKFLRVVSGAWAAETVPSAGGVAF